MGLRHSPLQINLKEIPPEGEEFTYSAKSGELTSTLKELIGTNEYEVQFKVMPMGNTFDLRGTIKSSMNLECSLCAIDFKFPVNVKLHELIVINKPMAKGDQQTRANHAHEWESQGPDYIILESSDFDVAAYIHEMVALAEPTRPLGKADCDVACDNLTEEVKRAWKTPGSDEAMAKANPFKVLEKIKLKS